MHSLHDDMTNIGRQAVAAFRSLASAETGQKNRALLLIADAIVAGADELISENAKDLEAGRRNQLDTAFIGPIGVNAVTHRSDGRRFAPGCCVA